MNTISFHSVISQAPVTSANGLESKTAIPLANSFATLFGVMINPQSATTQVHVGQALTLDELLAEIDQLLAQLADQQGDTEESLSFSDGALLSEAPLEMIPVQEVADMIKTLIPTIGSSLDASNVFENMRDSSLSTNLLSYLAVFSKQNSNDALGQSVKHSNSLTQPVQQQLLLSLQTVLHVAKEGQITMTQDELAKMKQILNQLSNSIGNKVDWHRGSVAEENKSILFRGLESHSFSRVIAPVRESLINNSGTQLMQQESTSSNSGETSSTTTKVGFHQMMMGSIQSGAQPSTQTEMSLPIVRAQHFQNDMNDFLVRQLQMTRFPNGVSEARIKLFPENLGSVEIKLTIQQGILTAQFMAETLAGKELLESQLAGLRASLLSTGLQVEKLEVNMPNNPNNGQAQDSLYRQGSDQREQQAESQETYFEDESEEDFSTVFEQFSQAI